MAASTLRLIVILMAATAFASSLRAEPAANVAKQSDAARDQAARRARKAQIEFDAVALQALIEPMMSGMKGGPLGSGQAGRYWQSLMTEHIARHLASSGRLPLLATRPNTSRSINRTLHFNKAPKHAELDRAPRQHASASPWQTDIHRSVDGGETHVEAVK
jgi:hypothetical protein